MHIQYAFSREYSETYIFISATIAGKTLKTICAIYVILHVTGFISAFASKMKISTFPSHVKVFLKRRGGKRRLRCDIVDRCTRSRAQPRAHAGSVVAYIALRDGV